MKFTHQEFNQYAFGDDVEVLENFEEYPLNKTTDQNLARFELTVESFKDKKVKIFLKEAIFDCIAHHQDLLNICTEFDKRTNMFLLGKVADVNFLLTAALFAIVSKFLTVICLHGIFFIGKYSFISLVFSHGKFLFPKVFFQNIFSRRILPQIIIIGIIKKENLLLKTFFWTNCTD